MVKKNWILSICFCVLLCLGYGLVFLFKIYYNPLYEFETIENNNGVFREFYATGKIKSIESYFKSLRHGKSIYFSEKGDTLEYQNYVFGKKEGDFFYYTKSGKLVIVETYKNDVRKYRNILNDSLYQYEYMAYETGLNMFENNCSNCHSTIEEIVKFKDSTMVMNKLDSIHLCILDSLVDTITLKNYLKINESDIRVIQFYKNEIIENNTKNKNKFIINRNTRKRIVFHSKR